MADKITEQVVLNLFQLLIAESVKKQTIVGPIASNPRKQVAPGTRVIEGATPPEFYGAYDISKTSYEEATVTLESDFFTGDTEIPNNIKIDLNDNFILEKDFNNKSINTPTKNINSLEPLLTVETKIFAALTPIIKIYRIDKTSIDDPTKEKTRLYIFDDKPRNIFQNSNDVIAQKEAKDYATYIENTGNGLGAGIKSLNFTLAGTNPVESTRAVNVTLELLFQSIDDFLGYTSTNSDLLDSTLGSDPTDPQDISGIGIDKITNTRNYLALISRPNPKGKFNNSVNDFKIKLQIYWQFDVNVLRTLGASEELIQVLQSTKLELTLSLITHSLEFSENGNINLKIDYFGGVEKAITSNEAFIFKAFKQNIRGQIANGSSDSVGKKTEQLREISIIYDQYKKNCSTTITPLSEQIQEVNNIYTDSKIAAIREELKKVSPTRGSIDNKFDDAVYRSLSQLLKRCQLTLTPSEETSIVSVLEDAGTLTAPENQIIQLETFELKKEDQPEEEKTLSSEASSDREIFFYTFGNIVKSFLQLALETEEIKILFGFIPLKQSLSTTQRLNIADIAISSDQFQRWMSSYITLDNIDKITLSDLIKNLINGLLAPSFQTEFVRETSNPSRTSGTNSDKKIDFIYVVDPNTNVVSISCTERSDEICGEVYTSPTSVSDSKRKILHLFVGNNFGIAKNIKFKRIDVPFVREAKATANGFTPLNTLRDVYNADVEMVGNMLFYPGDLVYLRPNYRLGNPSKRGELANIMGLGGYYTITKVSSTIQNSIWNTTMECYWQKSGDDLDCNKEEISYSTCENALQILLDDKLKQAANDTNTAAGGTQ